MNLTPIGDPFVNSNSTTTRVSHDNFNTVFHNPFLSTIILTGPTPRIKTDEGTIDLNELIDLIKILKERLLIISPNFEKHEKYAALKKAYDNYMLIEAMVSGENNDVS